MDIKEFSRRITAPTPGNKNTHSFQLKNFWVSNSFPILSWLSDGTTKDTKSTKKRFSFPSCSWCPSWFKAFMLFVTTGAVLSLIDRFSQVDQNVAQQCQARLNGVKDQKFVPAVHGATDGAEAVYGGYAKSSGKVGV